MVMEELEDIENNNNSNIDDIIEVDLSLDTSKDSESKKMMEKIKNLSKYCEDERKYWRDVVFKLTKRLEDDIKSNINVESEIINERQMILETKQKTAILILKFSRQMKEKYDIWFEYFSTECQHKLNSTEKNKQIEVKLRYHQEVINILENHVDYLKSTEDNFKTMNFTVKNKITVYGIFGLD